MKRAVARLATLALCVAALGGAVATAQEDQAPTDPAGPSAPGGLPRHEPHEPSVVQLVDQTTFVAPEDVLHLGFELDEAPDGALVELALYPRVTSRIQFGETLERAGLGEPVRTFGPLENAALPRGDDGVVRLELPIVPADAELPFVGFQLADPGVYPLVLTVTTADGSPVDQLVSHVVRLPPDEPETVGVPLSVGLVVSLDAPLALDSEQPGALDPQILAGIDETVAALAEHPGIPLTVSPRPETLEALAATGGTSSSTLATLSGALEGRQVQHRTWVPVNLGDWARHGLLEGQLAAGATAVHSTLGAPPSSSTWSADVTMDPQALGQLVDRGVQQVLLPEHLLDPADLDDLAVTLTQQFTIADDRDRAVPAVQTDELLENLLTSSPQPALAANRVLADLSVLALDLPDIARHAVLRTPGAAGAPEALRVVLAELEQAAGTGSAARPLLEPVTLESLFDRSAPVAPEEGGTPRDWTFEPPGTIGAYPQQLAEAQAAVNALGSTFPGQRSAEGDDDPTGAPDRLLLASADRSLDDEQRRELLEQASLRAHEALEPIVLPDQGAITLTDTESVIPIAIDNGSNETAVVRLHLRADRLAFPDGDAVELELEPGPNRHEIRVETRATGAFPIGLSLRTADDQVELAAARFTVRSTAVSGIGLVLSLCAGLFLALWWIRNIRSTRRRRQLVTSRHPSLGYDPDEPDRPSEGWT